MSLDGREALYDGSNSDGHFLRRPMSPHLDVYRFRLSMALSILNRISGVASAVGFGLAVTWLGSLAAGSKEYGRAQRVVNNPLGKLALAGWGVATVYHFVAGIRHLIWDDGHRFEKHQINEDGRITVAVTGGLSGVLLGAVFVLSRCRRKARVQG
ncbi:succinate dehydrogenase, cytochrome b556 subunit [Brytella acorum]|uniref:Succinate dehydrogenase cytochrome b556 subunit n=1 Tax=Brytella acorum TaxID=2959299 RepID=A0AA35XXN7_9PROT|nr:succinate dehydrogenase, cytochrome b556 subunit [Brytella acorum]MDF3623403.1 succinate dehydrogenase, cytochrome b556 subunit [Brytella acorum]CAI9120510.1 succinate dehydrogenase, cytochrome b556 subunit [Brytella acorum]